MEPTQEHPLKIDFKESDSRKTEEKVEDIQKDLDSVAIDWKLMNRATECSCSSPFDNLSKKNYCRKCGEVFCMRCILKREIPGHIAHTPLPVCKTCCENLES